MAKQMKTIDLTNEKYGITVTASESGITIDSGWSVPILADTFAEYLKNYNKSSDKGFIEVSARIVLIHRDARITFTQPQVAELISFFNDYYGL
ncbi:hypothetical protein OS175_10940 [Marinicella sp. S1101]|uniref:hypothetical protein n=1 Tax=Marinicella marina TaxID=2996016 RepID=UPI002260CBAE|nr:hypothetical protein [Marinicella marina]MCX7554398.1 hypothetical protein [Marinicella marina]MDJ1138611.1 hypothetical protein [Marinicella marina]